MSLSINPAAIGCTLFGSGRRYSNGYTWPEQLTITRRSQIVSYNYFFESSPQLSINYFSDCTALQSRGGSAYDGITGDNGIILNGFMQQSFLRRVSTPSVIQMGSYDAAVAALSAALSAAPYVLQEILIYEFGICRCPDGSTPLPYVKPHVFRGNAAPPPPPPKNMDCCSCNDIATIIAENALAEIKQHQATRDLIDRRTLEGLREINKMLQGMQINLDLQPVIDRLNQLEANLWNGLNGLGEG